ncbi:hypothetical protein DKX38_004968 [Salix brachista]|uniref:Uncharacterized protein n=1 Tax=Salix brachista TaxID=2182728 RepID=A0A5N5NBK4_9ROSI|nr:hypothetical protein DKX38_004968 [Salix brachista]
MSLKLAADNFPTLLVGEKENFVVVREYDEGRDKVGVEEMEKRCEIGQRGKPSLVTDLMGDPIDLSDSPFSISCYARSRFLDAWMPWLRLPSFPDVFRQFGVYFLYGLHMEGKDASRLMKALCAFAHNMARDDDGCGALVAEVGQRDPVREVIPHWRKFSLAEDVRCIKNLADEKLELICNHLGLQLWLGVWTTMNHTHIKVVL